MYFKKNSETPESRSLKTLVSASLWYYSDPFGIATLKEIYFTILLF